MSVRISAERLAQLIDFASWPQLHESVTPEVASALSELQQSRALLTELRARADVWRTILESGGWTGEFDRGRARAIFASLKWLDSLLAAHDAQQAPQYKYCAKCGQHLCAHCDAQQAEGK